MRDVVQNLIAKAAGARPWRATIARPEAGTRAARL